LTAAAKAEGVAPAIMGRRLDALEEHLGVKLMVRTTRRISLTHEGSAFLEDCQRLLSDVCNAEASVSAGGVKATGHLRITAPAGFGRRHVAPLVPRFRDLHPDVTISLNLSDRVVDLAGEGFDCAVRVGICRTRPWSACALPTTAACAWPRPAIWSAAARPSIPAS
jgi:DNA-binding transcriptional LysR family regulator